MSTRRRQYASGMMIARGWLRKQRYSEPGIDRPRRPSSEMNTLSQPLSPPMQAGARHALHILSTRGYGWSGLAEKKLETRFGVVASARGTGVGRRKLRSSDTPNFASNVGRYGTAKPKRTGRNVGSFKGRKGQWAKGKGGRFIGSK